MARAARPPVSARRGALEQDDSVRFASSKPRPTWTLGVPRRQCAGPGPAFWSNWLVARRQRDRQDQGVVRPRRRARGLLGLWLGAMLVAGCGGGGAHGHWTDPDARLVDGVWIGSPIACPPVRDECAPIEDSARGGLSDADAARVARITWVSLPTRFVTDEGQTVMPGRHVGIWTWAAALVTLDDGAERVVGMLCMFSYSGGDDGRLNADARCARQPLRQLAGRIGSPRVRAWHDPRIARGRVGSTRETDDTAGEIAEASRARTSTLPVWRGYSCPARSLDPARRQTR